MSPLVASLVLAAGIDGGAALQHASALSALGPHKWGSPLTRAAADYVEAQFREAGLQEVRQQAFVSHGLSGSNVIGVLRAPGPEFVVIGAHHDSAPLAPGAYDDGGGVGVLIETARVLAKQPTRPRTLVFVSFDGEEAWSTGETTTAGARAYIAKLGDSSRDLVGALIIEMCGWEGGTPTLHPLPYADPLQPGAYVVTPAWLARAVLRGAERGGAPFASGDPLIPWLYQPAVRSFRAGLYGDDLAFAQAGLPAVFVSDSSFTSFYPWYHQPSDTKDKLSAKALTRMGQGVLAAVTELARTPRGALEPQWFAAFGQVFGRSALALLGTLTLAGSLFAGWRAGGPLLAWRGAQACLFALLLWRHPLPALFILLPPTLLSLHGRVAGLLGLLPCIALIALGALAWQRDMAHGLWLQGWEIAALLGALALLFAPSPAARKPARGKAPRPRRR